jgi:hypothetical protein
MLPPARRRRSHTFVGVALAATAVVTGSVAAPAPQAAATSAGVVINELHYNPADDAPSSEFIELHNAGGAPVDLSGWNFTGITYTFPAGTSLGAGQFLVLRSGQYSGGLSNGGERIRLRNASNTVIDQLEYDDVGLWPAMADGEGPSLERRDPLGPTQNPGNWVSGGPTPGAANSNRGPLLPWFSNVTHTVLPAAGAPVDVTATLTGATSATLVYRIGFGPEVSVPMSAAGTTMSAQIPGQAAGALVRYRLSATAGSGTVGTWPRQGDGMNFTGTTVATSATSTLLRFEWFMEDSVYRRAFRDLTLRGDDGYPAVFAYAGKIFDNSKVRVKGQASRSWPKKKWKMILPAGHELTIPGVLPEPVDEFGLHSSWSDKSFLRETLASEMIAAAGIPVSQTFPVRLERNGTFYGLYTYVEQPDGTWRDRFGLDDSYLYEVGGGTSFGTLAARDATLSQTAFRNKYERETFEYLPDTELRTLISTLNRLGGSAERRWIYENIDVPNLVNSIAAAVVLQHQDIGHKNYRLAYREFGMWQMYPTDFDLTLGRRWSNTSGSLDSSVYVGGAFEHPGGPLFGPFWFDAELSQMVRRRIRSLTEQLLVPANWQTRINQLVGQVATEAANDRSVWRTYGTQQTPAAAANDIMTRYIQPQYARILGALARANRVARTAQPAVPTLTFAEVSLPATAGGTEWFAIGNTSNDTVDLSGFTVPELGLTIPNGVVVLPGKTALFTTFAAGRVATVFPNRLIGGRYATSLFGKTALTLLNRTGAQVAVWPALGVTADTTTTSTTVADTTTTTVPESTTTTTTPETTTSTSTTTTSTSVAAP